MAASPVAPRVAPAAPLVDTHAHLNDRRFSSDVERVIARAQTAGVVAMVVVAYDLRSSATAIQLAQRFPCLWATVGIHPHHAKEVDGHALAELEHLAQRPRVVAIGECGVDFYRDLSPRPAQHAAFEAQLDLARRMGLPVVVHCREAMLQTTATLAERWPLAGGVMHCFDGTATYARRVVDLGMFVSAAGTLTYRRDRVLAEALAAVPLDRIVVETDCPWLAPAGHRRERNEPVYLPLVASALAHARHTTFEAIARQTSRNAAVLFRTPALAAPLEQVA